MAGSPVFSPVSDDYLTSRCPSADPVGAATSRRPGHPRRALVVPALVALTVPILQAPPVWAQESAVSCLAYSDSGDGWNGARVLRIIDEAVRERRHAFSDTTLRAFDAYAEGRVDFLADFGAVGGEHVVRADRIAIDLQWARGRGSLQTLVGRRRVQWAPTRVHYHVDHLSLVMENFGDTIQVGEGDEVEAVLHPIAPGAVDFYQYRLVDSTTVMIGPHTSMVYRIQVRPGCADAPGVVGTLDMDFESLAIARLTASFTPASYVDATVSQVSISLVNGWVDRRWWLPVEQRVEVRRQMEWMDLPFATTIRSSFRILDYDLDPPAHYGQLRGHRVAALPQAQLETYAGWRSQDLGLTTEQVALDSTRFASVRREAVQIAAGRYLSAGSRVRLFLPDVSSGIRYRRAEGLLLGVGASYRPAGRTEVFGWTGYPFDRQRLEGTLELRQGLGASTVSLKGYANRLTDVGPFGAASGIISSFGAAFWGDDYTDPFFREGVALSLARPLGDWTTSIGLAWEEHSSAPLVAGAVGDVEPRPVRAIDDGTDLHLDFSARSRLGSGLGAAWSMALNGQLGLGGDFGYTRWTASFEGRPPDPDAVWQWEADGAIALATGTIPRQRLFLLGGRGTTPGYGFRAWGGDQGAYALVAVSRAAFAPWVRLRVLGAAGWVEATMVGREAAHAMGVSGSEGVRPSLGGGLGLLWDLVRIDAALGLDGGEWEWMVSVNPSWRAPL